MEIYLNNAGAGIITQETYDVITKHMLLERKIGAYKAAQEANESVKLFYKNVKELINAPSENNIAFVDSASRGWNIIINGLKLNPGDTIVTLSSEFGTNLLSLYNFAQTHNLNVKVIHCDNQGRFDISSLEQELLNGAKVIAISHAAAQGSIVNPIVEIGVIAQKYNVKYIVDGCQGVGQLPVDVQSIKCDAYITSGRKWLRGPRGTGFIYVKNPQDFTATEIDLASADLILDGMNTVVGLDIVPEAKRFELWEKNIANLLGFSSAIEQFLRHDIAQVNSEISFRANSLREIAAKNSAISIIGEIQSLSGIVGLYVPNHEMDIKLKNELTNAGIIFSTMANWDCPLFYPPEAPAIIRLSPHFDTSKLDINKVEEILSKFN